jgi:uncharacterized phage protein (TIGR02220 family)
MPGYTYIGKLKNSFICDKQLTPYDVRVFLSLKKWETWKKPVSIETMAGEIGMTRKSFSKSIKNLETFKYIEIERNTNWDCNKYSILKKARGNEIPPEGNNLPIDGNEIPLNEGNEIPTLITPISNTPIIKKINKKKEPDTVPYNEIITYLNEVTGKNFRAVNKHRALIKARWNEGYSLDDFKKVIDNKVSCWHGNQDYSKFLRPSTLFGTKFDGYLNEEPEATLNLEGVFDD